jgi:hypothetical protein
MTRKLNALSIRELVELFTDITLQQYPAVLGNDARTYNRLYAQMDAVCQELKSRPGDERRSLIALYAHPNVQVRLAAARRTLALNYKDARRVIEDIANSGKFPMAGDAGMTLWNLDRGVFKPT